MAPDNDWAWPKLIESLQNDIARLERRLEQHGEEAASERAKHRADIDRLIHLLEDLRAKVNPILTEREENAKLRRETKWSWIERAMWGGTGFLAFAAWEFIKRHLGGGS